MFLGKHIIYQKHLLFYKKDNLFSSLIIDETKKKELVLANSFITYAEVDTLYCE
jgi:hypothetical protein